MPHWNSAVITMPALKRKLPLWQRSCSSDSHRDVHVQYRHNLSLVMPWWRQGLRSTPTCLHTHIENHNFEIRPSYGLICTIGSSIIVRWHLCIKMVPMSSRVQTIVGPKPVSIITVPHTCRNQTWLSPFSAHGCFIILCTPFAKSNGRFFQTQ